MAAVRPGEEPAHLALPLQVLSRLMVWTGALLALIGLVVLPMWVWLAADPVDLWRGEVDLRGVERGLAFYLPLAALGPLIAGVGLLAAGWFSGALSTSALALKEARDSIEAFTEAERGRVRRFERIYGQVYEEMERMQRVLQDAYVVVPGPRGTLVKAPVEIGEHPLARSVLEDRIPEEVSVAVLPRMTPEFETGLSGMGIATLRDFALANPEEIALRVGRPEDEVRRCQHAARLLALEALTPEDAECLADAGVASVADLATREAGPLAQAARDAADGEKCATEDALESWIRSAQDLLRDARARTARRV